MFDRATINETADEYRIIALRDRNNGRHTGKLAAGHDWERPQEIEAPEGSADWLDQHIGAACAFSVGDHRAQAEFAAAEFAESHHAIIQQLAASLFACALERIAEARAEIPF